MSSTSSIPVGAQKAPQPAARDGSDRPNSVPKPASSSLSQKQDSDADFAAVFRKRMKAARSKPQDSKTAAPSGAGPAPSVSPTPATQPPRKTASAEPSLVSSTEDLKPAPYTYTSRDEWPTLATNNAPKPAAAKAPKQKQAVAPATAKAAPIASSESTPAAPAPSTTKPAPAPRSAPKQAVSAVSNAAPPANNATKPALAPGGTSTVKQTTSVASSATQAAASAPKPAVATQNPTPQPTPAAAPKAKAAQATAKGAESVPSVPAPGPSAAQQPAKGTKKTTGRAAEPAPYAPSHEGRQYSTVPSAQPTKAPVTAAPAKAKPAPKGLPKDASNKILQALSREADARQAEMDEMRNFGKQAPPAGTKAVKPPAAPPVVKTPAPAPPVATSNPQATKPAAGAAKAKVTGKTQVPARSHSDDEDSDDGSTGDGESLLGRVQTSTNVDAYPDDDSEGVPDLIGSSDDEATKPAKAPTITPKEIPAKAPAPAPAPAALAPAPAPVPAPAPAPKAKASEPPAPAKKEKPAKAAKAAPPPAPVEEDSDGLPELIGSSDEEGFPRDKPAAKLSPTAPVKSQQSSAPVPTQQAESSDESSVEDAGAAGGDGKKKKKKKKKKPKKKSKAAELPGAASLSDSEDERAAVKAKPQPAPAISAEEARRQQQKEREAVETKRVLEEKRVIKERVAAEEKRVQEEQRVEKERAAAEALRVLEEQRAAKRREEEFCARWQPVLDALTALQKRAKAKGNGARTDVRFSWAAQKFAYDVIVENTEEERRHQALTADVLAATAGAAVEDALDEVDMYIEDPALAAGEGASESAEKSAAEAPVDLAQCIPVDLSISVKKWLEKADEAYREMFQRRITQLASGQRSYALSKRLKHCAVPIYETKLDAGQRILWSQLMRRDAETNVDSVTLMVWFAAKHDHVPHLLRLIEHSCGRTIRQVEGAGRGQISDSTQLSQVTARYISCAPDRGTLPMLSLPDEAVLLDPQGNIPLKLYPVPDLTQLSLPNWRAPLRLNKLEQSVRSQSGTVLLLGRSGTGKTLCLMDRMHHDRLQLQLHWRQLGPDSSSQRASQLFVARSLQLCELVRRYQQYSVMDAAGLEVDNHFLRMRQFLNEMERKVITTSTAPVTASAALLYHQTHRETDCVDFSRFNREIFPVISEAINTGKKRLDALIVWTQIRSFLKGSLDAVLAGGALPLDTYLDPQVFGKDRCRLQPEQRRLAFELFQRYELYIRDHHLWDDMDKIRHILFKALRLPSKATDIPSHLRDNSWEIHYHKVYVDEIQDYTQAEIALFLLAVGFRTDSLFLAGDPAQSVVEGVDFRFEEVRSLVHKLTSGREHIPRSIKLLTNYRSHNGVLACAAAIIDKLLLMFPGSANVLTKDEGLFTGPRPNFCIVKEPLEILSALGTGVAVLTPDNSHWVKRRTNAAGELSGGMGGLTLGDGMGADLGDDFIEEGAGSTAHPQTATTANVAEDGILGLGNTVMGIRAAKGLEFSDVLVLDFFAGVSAEDAKAWKVLFAENAEVEVRDQQFAYPQLEPQLKMLYTAITRSMNRLLFVETTRSPAGDAFFRWLERHQLADKLEVSTIKAHGESRFITSDEWKVRGIQLALQADNLSSSSAASETVDEMLVNAIRCFSNAGDTQLKGVVQVQRKLLQLTAASAAREEGAESPVYGAEAAAVQVLQEALQCGLVEEVRDAAQVLWEGMPEGSHGSALLKRLVCDRLSELCE